MARTTIVLLAVSIFVSLLASVCAREVNFTDIFVDNPSLEGPIPKVAHFVFSKVKPLIWIEYASIKSAYTMLGAEKINLWVPSGTQFPGPIWQHALRIPGITIREIEMPTKIYGQNVSVLAHVSDIVRLEAIYTEGGIYLDYNAIAMQSSDSIIYSSETKSTVMGRELAGLCNAMIMSKKHAPFLREWMSAYTEFKDSDWMSLSIDKPWEIYSAGGKDLTVLGLETWFYPSYLDGFKTFLGHSWAKDIHRNLGIHLWSTYGPFYAWLTPDAVREIDTPFFCRIRSLFDGIDGVPDSVDWRLNPNCSVLTNSSLLPSEPMVMSAFDFSGDTIHKLVDISGNHLHGWAPYGTGLPKEGSKVVRELRQSQYAFLPVPGDYDARTGTIMAEIMFQIGTRDDASMTLTKLRLDTREMDFYWRFTYDNERAMAGIEVEWASWRKEDRFVIKQDLNTTIYNDDKYHRVSIAWDRRNVGFITVHVDENEVLQQNVSLVENMYTGQELWLNAVSHPEGWSAVDGKVRGRLRRLVTSIDALGVDDQVKAFSMAAQSPLGSFSATRLQYSAGIVSLIVLIIVFLRERRVKLLRRLIGPHFWLSSENNKRYQLLGDEQPPDSIMSDLILINGEEVQERRKWY